MPDQQYLVIARKWRPQRFDDVVGQEHITRTLHNAIASGRIHHAFLFIGSRGIGKTTTARILAKALNCLNSDKPTPEPCGVCENCKAISAGSHIDVLEIDGASNNSVDDVRELRENIQMVPSLGRYKVYIIDEVHQLSTSAFNALLKTLEEPPPHAVFVLATTEAHKIPATIISRCQRYDFRRVPIPTIIALLEKILESEGVKADTEALHAIARTAEGGIRDAESILDELITYCDKDITFQDVNDVLGLIDWRLLHTMSEGILNHDVLTLLQLVDDIVSGGKDLSQFIQEVLFFYRNLLICKTAQDGAILHLPEAEIQELQQQADRYPLTHLIRLVEQFAELSNGFDSQLAQRIALEAMLIRVAKVSTEVSVDTVMEKLLALGAGGLQSPDTATPPSSTTSNAPPPTDPPQAGPAELKTPTVPADTARRHSEEPPKVYSASSSPAPPAKPSSDANVPTPASEQPPKNDRLTQTHREHETTQPDTAALPVTTPPSRESESAPAVESAPASAPSREALYDDEIPEAPEEESEDFDTYMPPPSPKAPGGKPTTPPPDSGANLESAKTDVKVGVTPKEIQSYLQMPGIAAVVDTFKGRIVDVRREGQAESDTSRGQR